MKRHIPIALTTLRLLLGPIALLCAKVWLNAASTVPVVVLGLVTVMVWQLMIRLYVGLVPVQPLPSVTVTVMGNVPNCVGVPDNVPPVPNVRPFGSVLVVVNVAPPLAPLCVNV